MDLITLKRVRLDYIRTKLGLSRKEILIAVKSNPQLADPQVGIAEAVRMYYYER